MIARPLWTVSRRRYARLGAYKKQKEPGRKKSEPGSIALWKLATHTAVVSTLVLIGEG